MVSDPRRGAKGPGSDPVSIRFEVRGGFRRGDTTVRSVHRLQVSIRFEVRGGFRLALQGNIAEETVSIRFEVRGGFRHSRAMAKNAS